MYKIVSLTALTFMCFINLSLAQEKMDDKEQINRVVSNFKQSIEDKNLDLFLTLFVDHERVSWVGNSSFGTQFGSPSRFIKMLNYNNDEVREDFHNVKIWNDNLIAVVTFDYGFFVNNNISNWGKESWMLVKENGNWKITSVNYSMIFPKEKEYPFKD